MARIRRYTSSADDLTTEMAIEETMCGPDGDPKTLERFRRYHERRGQLGSACYIEFEAEHRAIVLSRLSFEEWHRFGRAEWLKRSAVTK